jgi:error-prone DNA polymerase
MNWSGDGAILPVLVQSRNGYSNLASCQPLAHLRNEKGYCTIEWDELPEFAQGLVALLGTGTTHSFLSTRLA